MIVNKNSEFGEILLQNIETKKLMVFLKSQVESEIIFLDSNNNQYFETILLKNRIQGGLYINNNGTDFFLTYKELLEKFSEIISMGYMLNINISEKIFNEKFSLINLIVQNNINPSIVENCIYIDYVKGIYEIKNKNLPDGNSDKIFYFERNDTVLAFSEEGATLITENDGLTSITDILCN